MVTATATVTGTVGSKPVPTYTKPTSQPSEKIVLKCRDGSICAVGMLLPEQTVIHGQLLRKGNTVVSIERTIQVGAKTWYPDKFGEDDLVKGAIVEWPLNMISKSGDLSSVHTRSRKRM